MATEAELATEFDCIIVSPDKVVFEGKIERLLAPSRYGDLALLPNHTPIYSEILEGEITIWQRGDQKEVQVENGLIRAKDNHVTVIIGFSEDF